MSYNCKNIQTSEIKGAKIENMQNMICAFCYLVPWLSIYYRKKFRSSFFFRRLTVRMIPPVDSNTRIPKGQDMWQYSYRESQTVLTLKCKFLEKRHDLSATKHETIVQFPMSLHCGVVDHTIFSISPLAPWSLLIDPMLVKVGLRIGWKKESLPWCRENIAPWSINLSDHIDILPYSVLSSVGIKHTLD